MKTPVVFVLALSLTGGGLSLAAEKKVRIQDVPPAVQQTIKDQTKNAKMVGLIQEVEDGKTQYELETKVDGHGRDIIIDTAGAVTTIEEEMAIDKLPGAARSAIEKAAAGGKITKVESVTKGNVVTYEAAITKKGKKSEFIVNADGSAAK